MSGWSRRVFAAVFGAMTLGLLSPPAETPGAAVAAEVRTTVAGDAAVTPERDASASDHDTAIPVSLDAIPVSLERAEGPPGAAEPAEAPQLALEAAAEVCPEGMVLVEGEYCTDVRHTCKRWLDEPGLPYARCADYTPPARCAGNRVRLRFCIDRYELREADSDLPLNHQSFVTGSQACKAQGKRICRESEWNFACEGEEMRPYPYGWERKPICNQDRSDLFEKNPRRKILRDLREPVDARPECESPFGVLNLAGNVDESVARDGAERNHPFRNALKGGWWMAARNRCRPATTAHDDYYEGIQTGVRCCADAPGADPQPTG